MPVVHLDDRALIRLGGADAQTFLHGLATTDIAGLPEGVSKPGALLTPQGKILFDFMIRRAGGGFVLDIRRDMAGDFAKRLKLYRLRSKVEISEPEQQVVAVSWDRDSGSSSNNSTASHGDSSAVADSRFPVSVRRWSGGDLGAAPATRAAWDSLRIAHGVAELGPDYASGEAFPHDVNFDQTGGVSFAKGCYVGQEVVSRMHHRGTTRRRVVVAAAARPLEPGTEVFAAGRPCGRLGTAVGAQALAIVRLDRVKAAMDAGAPITAGGIDVGLTLPPGVAFGWPDATTAGEE